MLKLEDLITNIDIRNLTVFESALAHEKKNIGVVAFCKKYEGSIEDFKTSLPHMEFCFLLAYLEHLDPTFSYDKTVKLDGYVPDIEDMQALQWGFEDEVDLEGAWNKALLPFRSRGFLLQELSEAVGYGASNIWSQERPR